MGVLQGLAILVAIFLLLNNIQTIQKYLSPANQIGKPTTTPEILGKRVFEMLKENIVLPLWLLALIIFLILVIK
jgi:hypothetical protein